MKRDASLWVRNGRLADRFVDMELRNGFITQIVDAGASPVRAKGLDAQGGLLSPPYADPHIHLDAALLGADYPNQSGTLWEGIANWAKAKTKLTRADTLRRATQVLRWCVAHGTTSVRSHADTGCTIGVDALLSLRQEVADWCTLEVVAFPQDGIYTGSGREKALRRALEAGCDAVGAIPHYERTTAEGTTSLRHIFELAAEFGSKVDVHCDETDDPGSRHLETLCALTIDHKLQGRVVAGHCTAMHSYPTAYADKVIGWVVEAQVQVVANPLDNIVLQGRFDDYPKRRGITRIPELLAADAHVGIGHDSVMDPWYPLGTGNLLDAASMLIHVCQMTSIDEMNRIFRVVTEDNHRPFGRSPRLVVGEPADLLVHTVDSPIEVLRTRKPPRWVLRGGNVIAETTAGESRVCGRLVRWA